MLFIASNKCGPSSPPIPNVRHTSAPCSSSHLDGRSRQQLDPISQLAFYSVHNLYSGLRIQDIPRSELVVLRHSLTVNLSPPDKLVAEI